METDHEPEGDEPQPASQADSEHAPKPLSLWSAQAQGSALPGKFSGSQFESDKAEDLSPDAAEDPSPFAALGVADDPEEVVDLHALGEEGEVLGPQFAGDTEVGEESIVTPVEPVSDFRADTADEARTPGLLAAFLGSTILHSLLLVGACFFVYSNAYHHEFHLDSTHVVRDNPSIRSLGNLKSFFTDPGTFSSLRPNVDYRPVLVLSYALDYAISEYEMSQFHLTQILLHAACVLGLYGLTRRLMGHIGETGAAWASLGARLVAFAAALVFAVHPTNSGVVDYLSARSSLLTAAFLLPALLLYIGPAGARSDRTRWGAALLYTLALFTKVEAIGCIGIFFAFEVWQTAVRTGHRRGFLGDLLATPFRAGFEPGALADFGATLWRGWLRRMWPILAVTCVYWIQVRTPLMQPFDYEAASRPVDLGPLQYFLTQLTAWWHYVARWFLGAEFIADNAVFAKQVSFLSIPVLLAAGAWVFVAACLLATWRRAPHLTFLAIAALAMLFPTSSFRPLAEMVNEHRPYLPLALLSLVWMIPIGMTVLRAWPKDVLPTLASVVGLGAMVWGLGGLTLERNRVFLTSESYWQDVLAKAPSGRAHVNYGLTFMARGEDDAALEHFLASLEMSPYWHITHTNLGIVYNRLGQAARAQELFDRAVEYDEHSGTARTWRGEHHLAQRKWAAAAEDFELSQPKSNEHYRNKSGLAKARAWLGDLAASRAAIEELKSMDPVRLEREILELTSPFLLHEERHQESIDLFESLARDLPDNWWVYRGLATARAQAGDSEGCYSAARRLLALDAERVGMDIVSISTPFFTDEARAEAGFQFFKRLQVDLPDSWWVYANLATLAHRTGRSEEALAAEARSAELLPEDPPATPGE